MLQGLLGALTLRVNKTAYKIGETPTYTISGGPPNSTIAWTSYLDGQSTGEYQAQYGQFTDANGGAVVAGGPWKADFIGAWEKQVLIVGPDGSFHNGRVVFSVSEDGSPIAPPPPPPINVGPSSGSSAGSSSGSSAGSSQIGSFFAGDLDLPVIGRIPKVAAYGGGALLFFFFVGSRGGKR